MHNPGSQNALISKLCLEDIPEIIELQRINNLSFWNEHDYKEVHTSDIYRCMTIKVNSRIKGFLNSRLIKFENLLEIVNIAVLPTSQNSGLGQGLLSETINFCRINRIETILLEVRRSNLPALKFYRKNNFALIGERREFYRSPTEDALLMRLDLKKLD